MQTFIEINGKNIGSKQQVFVIAEAGINHNGSLETAKHLVREAKIAGADCVKFQTFKASRVVTANAPKAEYQQKTTSTHESQLSMLEKTELCSEEFNELIDYCHKENILFLSTPYNIEDVDFLNDTGVAAFKLASIHIAEPYFLQYVANKGKPLILSTGMATLDEIDEAIRSIGKTGNNQIILLQCTTNYPSQIHDANLRTIPTMEKRFNTLIGYSDHTQTNTAAIASVALGACIVEKHFTLDKSLPGPDHSCSADPGELKKLINDIRETEAVLGSTQKSPTPLESTNALGMRRSIVAKNQIQAGEEIIIDNVTFKRPATGIPPKMLPNILGRKAVRQIKEDTMIDWSDLSPKDKSLQT